MKLIPIVLALTIFSPIGFGADVLSEVSGSSDGGESESGTVPTERTAKSTWGFLSDIGNGFEKRRAIMAGDGVAVSASVYAMALRQAERDNKDLKKLEKDRKEQEIKSKRVLEESARLAKVGKEYEDDAVKLQSNVSAALSEIAQTAVKLPGWTPAHQENLTKLLAENDKLGALKSSDGNDRIGTHAMLSLKTAWVDLESFIKKNPDAAKKIGLDGKLKTMSSLLSGASQKIEEKENQIMDITARINENSSVTSPLLGQTEEQLKQQMILATLNNSVNNLITNAEFSKVRSQLAFSHFDEIQKELAAKGVQAGDVKKAYKEKENARKLAAQYNNTPMGVYVNNQISKAMGSICEIVNNQCKNGGNASLFDFLDDTSRIIYKASEDVPAQIVKPETQATPQ